MKFDGPPDFRAITKKSVKFLCYKKSFKFCDCRKRIKFMMFCGRPDFRGLQKKAQILSGARPVICCIKN